MRRPHTPRGRGSRLSLLLAAMCMGLAQPSPARIVVLGNDLPPEPMVLDRSALQELTYGEILFNYYSDHKFEALTQLQVGSHSGLFDTDTFHAELLTGDLFVSYGLPGRAETIFDRLLKKDILAQLRAETWYHKAALDYRRGNGDSAARILASEKVRGLPGDLDASRHLMLANVRIAQNEFGEALASLYAIPPGTREGAYATYNMGVAMIRDEHPAEGVRLLASVVNLPEGTPETNALKDRAALAIGLTELKRKNLDAARNALSRIRADGPFSNEALLALGLVNFERGEFRKALPLWLELVRRNAGHAAVQEALMMAPRAYEELRAMPQALAGYQYAARVYREELKRVELAIRDIDRRDWLDKLVGQDPRTHVALDPMAPVRDYSASSGPEMTYLYKLFASHDFAERFREYNELQRIRGMLMKWRDEVPALEQAFSQQQSKLQAVLPPVRNQLVNIRRRQQTLVERASVMIGQIPPTLDMNNVKDLASYEQLQLWELTQALTQELDRLPRTQAYARYRERLRRTRGVLLYDIAEDAPRNRMAQQQQAAENLELAGIAAVRTEAVEKLVRDAALHIRGDLGQRIGKHGARIDAMIQETDRLLDVLGQILKNDALRVLAQSRIQLGNQLGEAHLAMARLQDASVVERLEQGASQ